MSWVFNPFTNKLDWAGSGTPFDPASPGPIGGTTPAAGTFTTLTATGQTSLGGAPDSESLRVLNVASAVNYLTARGATSGSSVTLGAAGLNGGIATIVQSKGSAGVELWTNGGNQRQFVAAHTASAVNYVQVTGSATTASPTIDAAGSDATLALTLRGKGSNGSVTLGTTFGTNFRAVGYSGATVVNYLQAQAAATTLSPVLSVAGSDTNISQVFQSKGTGAIDLAAGSRGVNISNGGTVTAITGTATGSGYTSIPSVAITAPTTAGGVQATATVAMAQLTTVIAGGGTGYTVNDVLSFVGGTGTAITVTVTTVSSGVITGFTVANSGTYTVLPTNPISVTGGTGSGATFNVNAWQTRVAGYTITNAGSGYVEQPTVTFSGGGGSGAAAYATVGSTPIVKSVAGAMNFQTAGGTQFAVVDNATPTSYPYISGGNGAGGIGVLGATNSGLFISARGTSAVTLQTNNFSQTQLNVAHTASAVNYVQVTGAATGNQPVISMQGSDSTIGMKLQAKGTSFIYLQNALGTNHFSVGGTSVAVNYLNARGNAAGTGPQLEAVGSDTNIDLTLTPKGTGNVRFGTYTASMALTVQGYIEIKDSGGTVRKLAVIA